MSIFIIFVRAGVLFEGASFLWDTTVMDIKLLSWERNAEMSKTEIDQFEKILSLKG